MCLCIQRAIKTQWILTLKIFYYSERAIAIDLLQKVTCFELTSLFLPLSKAVLEILFHEDIIKKYGDCRYQVPLNRKKKRFVRTFRCTLVHLIHRGWDCATSSSALKSKYLWMNLAPCGSHAQEPRRHSGKTLIREEWWDKHLWLGRECFEGDQW